MPSAALPRYRIKFRWLSAPSAPCPDCGSPSVSLAEAVLAHEASACRTCGLTTIWTPQGRAVHGAIFRVDAQHRVPPLGRLVAAGCIEIVDVEPVV